ncbi:MAG TPA: TolC family protein [Vicinamibacterales bacterium]|nr:TolC family protein [Vicinamibacterales bacterium]
MTEADALERQKASDPALRALAARVRSVEAEQAGRALWPNPLASVSRESVARASDLFVTARQELPISGRLGHLREAGKLAVEIADARAGFDIRERQAALRRAFARLLAAQEREALLGQSIADLHELIVVLRAREEAGEGSRYDRLRGERALADLEDDRAGAGIERTRAQIALAAFLGPDTSPSSLTAAGALDASSPLPSLGELLERAGAGRPDARAARLDEERLESERRAARALRLPTPSVLYGLRRSTAGTVTDNGYQVSLDVAVPLFDRGRTAVAFAVAEANRAALERAALRLRIDAEVREAHAAVALERDRAARYAQSMAASSEQLTGIARVAYEDGEMGILELLDARQQLLAARQRMLDLALSVRLAAIELDRVTGVEVLP